MTVSEHDPADNGRAPVTEADELIHHHTAFPDTRISLRLDRWLTAVGKAASWLWVVVTAMIIWAVVARYVFGEGSVLLEELQWHVSGVAWLMGLAYTLVVDDHVRVDVIHERLGLRTQGWIELVGILCLLLPFVIIAVTEMVPYAFAAYSVGEGSPAPAGLPDRWILKAVLPLSFMLIGVAAIARLLKVTALLFGWPGPVAAGNGNAKRGEAI